MRKNKSYYRTCQRAEKPDELAMVALHNRGFGKRFVEVFQAAKEGKSCPRQK
jgi:hypothetical protein|uniref:hypothetical protein n=1 Tax=Gilliamella sp. Nev6-6 TaxID=3120252 RepID=UPI0015CF65A7|nr:hypothetical protein [Gilliamella apicola]